MRALGLHLKGAPCAQFRDRFLHLFICFVSFATFCLLCAGALVTSTGSGLAVPDWPLSFGQFFPPMVGGVLFEHGHRLVAGTVALLITAFAISAQLFEQRRWVRNLAWIAVAMVLSQAILGGLTVLFKLPPSISVSHACLAQLFFCCVASLALVTSGLWRNAPDCSTDTRGRRMAALSIALSMGFFVQLLIGATMRHHGAGLAIPDFPTVFGGVLPQFVNFSIAINLVHRVWGFVLIVFVAVLAIFIYRHYPERLELQALLGMLLAALSFQIILGAFTIWLKKPVMLTMLHLATGAVCFALCVVFSLLVHRLFSRHATIPDLGAPQPIPKAIPSDWRETHFDCKIDAPAATSSNSQKVLNVALGSRLREVLLAICTLGLFRPKPQFFASKAISRQSLPI